MLSILAEQAGCQRHSSGISSRKQQQIWEQEPSQMHTQNNEGGEDTESNLCPELPGKQHQDESVCESADTALISSLSAVRAELCKLAERISLEDTGRSGCKQHLCLTALQPPLCCSPHIHGDRGGQALLKDLQRDLPGC